MIHCPKDRAILASNDVDGYRYHSCERCFGYWIPGRAIERALSSDGIASLMSGLGSDKGEIRCPQCETACTPIAVQECTLDFCRRCRGIWFDGGEVTRLKHLFPHDSSILDAEESAKRQPSKGEWAATILLEAIFAILSS